jgi:hypothetical protein
MSIAKNMTGAPARSGNGDQLSHCLIRAAIWPAKRDV